MSKCPECGVEYELQEAKVGTWIAVKVSKITLGKDDNLYYSISHDQADNKPTLRLYKKEE
jgi:hypothetical protein